MKEKLKMFSNQELCFVGVKYHIRNGDKSLCGRSPISTSGINLIGAREDYEGMCKRCVKIYHRVSSS